MLRCACVPFQRLNSLQMKFNTVAIKMAETEENRKNYELNISHLKVIKCVNLYLMRWALSAQSDA